MSSSKTGPSGESLRLDPEDQAEYARNFRGTPSLGVDESVNYDPTKTISQFSNPSEYLKSVRHEAEQLPSVSRAKSKPESQSSKNKNAELFTSQPLPGKEYAPEKGFADRVCTRFDHARVLFLNHALKLKTIPKTATCRPKLPLSPLPSWNDKEAWRYFCFGSEKRRKLDALRNPEVIDEVIDLVHGKFAFGDSRIHNQPVAGEPGHRELPSQKIAIESLKKGYPPLMRIVLRFNSQLIEALLLYHTEWIVEYGFSHEQGSWCYALLSAISLPLWPGAISVMRTLSKTCAMERATEAKKTDKTLLCSLNMIIVIIGKFFGQKDLLDAQN